jgi:DNA-binding CsgD family transcriptional regulator
VDLPPNAITLNHEELAFVVDFIAACRRAEDDAALEALLAALRLRLGATTVRAAACGEEADCTPSRNALPETTPDGLRSCQIDDSGGSACLFLNLPAGHHRRELLAHVAPHLLDAVARLAARPASAARPALTAREEAVLRWLAEGKSNWAIGQILGISERTVKYHLANLFPKLGVTTRAQAAAVAIGASLVKNN